MKISHVFWWAIVLVWLTGCGYQQEDFLQPQFMVQAFYTDKEGGHRQPAPPFVISGLTEPFVQLKGTEKYHIVLEIRLQRRVYERTVKHGQKVIKGISTKVLANYHGSATISGVAQWDAQQQRFVPVQTVHFQKGVCILPNVLITGPVEVHDKSPAKWRGRLDIRVLAGWLTLLPPLLAIILAIVCKQVLLALFCGVWLGASMLAGGLGCGLLRVVDTYLLQALANSDHASIVLFSMMIGGMIGIVARSGGIHDIVNRLSARAQSRMLGQLAAWFMGLIIFFDDYANTLLVGNTMRPYTDRLRISREKLAYIVDSTAAPVASLAIISTWIGYEVGLIQDSVAKIGLPGEGYQLFLASIPFRFYSILALIFVFLVAVMRRDYGPMYQAEKRAKDEGKYLRDGAQPLMDTESVALQLKEGVPLRWYNAALPILVVILVTIGGLLVTGSESIYRSKGPAGYQQANIMQIFGESNSYKVLLWSSFLGSLMAGLLVISQRILSLTETIDAWVNGVKTMVLAMMILLLAWMLSSICNDLFTNYYIIQSVGQNLPAWSLPGIVFVIAALTAFATGTSWGTMGILTPLAIMLAGGILKAQGLADEVVLSHPVFLGTIGAVLGGASFGDHCSPISDTTVMSSMASGSDHIDHVRTQMPYAITAALAALVCGYLACNWINHWCGLGVGIVVLVVMLRILGKRV